MPDSVLLLAWCASSASVIVCAYLVATFACGAHVPLRTRVVVSIIGVLVGQYLLGLALLATGLFGVATSWALVVLCAAASAVMLRSRRLRAGLATDLTHLRSVLSADASRPAWTPGTLVVGLALLLGWSRAARGIVTPPLDWDFLTYHGPRAAFWLSESTIWPSYDAVGMWQQYRAYPPAGDLITAWAMSLTKSDLCVAPTWTSVWAALVVATYAAARSAGGERRSALLGGLAVAFLPAAFNHMSSGYIDNALALGTLCGIACLIEGERARSPTLSTVGLFGFAAGAAMKLTGLPALGAAGLLWLRELYVCRERVRWGLVLALAGAALVTGLSWYGLAFAREGNPAYPHRLDLLGLQLPGASDATPAGWSKGRLGFIGSGWSLFFRGFFEKMTLHNGFGVGGLLLLAWGSVSLLTKWRPRGVIAPGMFAGGLWLLLWCMKYRLGTPGLDHGRYLLAIPALAAVVVAAGNHRRSASLLLVVIGVELFHALPWRWGHVDAFPLGTSLAVGTLIALAIAVVGRTLPYGMRAALALSLGALASFCSAAELRSLLRWDYYSAAAKGQLMASGPIHFCPSSQAYPIWQALGDAAPLTIDVSAGNHPLLTHWYIYPLLGERFQHRLVHVKTGLHFPEQQQGISEAQLESAAQAWLAGLHGLGADAVLLYEPLPIEAALASRARRAFSSETLNTRGATLLYVQ